LLGWVNAKTMTGADSLAPIGGAETEPELENAGSSGQAAEQARREEVAAVAATFLDGMVEPAELAAAVAECLEDTGPRAEAQTTFLCRLLGFSAASAVVVAGSDNAKQAPQADGEVWLTSGRVAQMLGAATHRYQYGLPPLLLPTAPDVASQAAAAKWAAEEAAAKSAPPTGPSPELVAELAACEAEVAALSASMEDMDALRTKLGELGEVRQRASARTGTEGSSVEEASAAAALANATEVVAAAVRLYLSEILTSAWICLVILLKSISNQAKVPTKWRMGTCRRGVGCWRTRSTSVMSYSDYGRWHRLVWPHRDAVRQILFP
jgi:hypothetical protein